jgi:hypothetical protein
MSNLSKISSIKTFSIQSVSISYIFAYPQKVKYIDVNGEKCKLVLVFSFPNISGILQANNASGPLPTVTIAAHMALSSFMTLLIMKAFKTSPIGTMKWISTPFKLFSNVNQKVACMLVGNKVDMSSKRAVTLQEGQALGISLFKQA